MKNFFTSRNTLYLIVIAGLALIAVDIAVLMKFKDGGELPVVESSLFAREEPVPAPEPVEWKRLNVPEPVAEKYTVMKPPIIEEPPVETVKIEPVEEKPKPVPVQEPLIRHEGEPAKIAIIIDDMGMNKKLSQQAVELNAPVTLAFLPYATNIGGMTKDAIQRGHELIIHMPMEAMENPVSLGPIALKSGMSDAEIDENLEKAFASFEGFEGMNNHMGSKVTKDARIMDRVMAKLKARGLFFVDSKTIGSSVGSHEAAQAGIKYADRDVFLDHVETLEFARNALRQTEKIANRKGYAIAIGHPKVNTLAALKEWLPTLKERGFVIVPVSELTRKAKIEEAPIVQVEQEAAPEVEPASGLNQPLPSSSPLTYELAPQPVQPPE